MTQNQNEVLAIQPVTKMPRLQLFQRQEHYPIVTTSEGDRIVVPLRDYQKFRGDASFWQFMFLVMTCGLIGIVVMEMNRAPVTVEKPVIVEKQVQVPVPTKCLVFCGK